MEQVKRRHYLVNKVFQFRYIAFVLLPLIMLLVALYYLIYYAVFNEMLIPEAIATTLLPAMRKVNVIVIIATPIVLFFIIRMALIFSNRIIGPIPRVEKELDKAIAGDFSVRIKARKNDVLKAFINKINTLIEKVDTTQKDS
jgi:signal transduction histidine kinase